jgi:hypothetical protein
LIRSKILTHSFFVLVFVNYIFLDEVNKLDG